MKQLKKNTIIIIILVALIFSCSENLVDPIDMKAEVIEDLSVIQTRLQFEKDKIYHYKIAIESNYLPSDSLEVVAYFTNGTTIIDIPLYDDGISDGSLRNDLVASNNIWSGGVNGLDFVISDQWALDLTLYIDGDIQIGHYTYDAIYVVNNILPKIDSLSGISSGSILESGFETKIINVAVSDSNNIIAPYDEQILKMQLFNNSEILVKENEYQRANINDDFLFNIDSTYAAGVEDSRGYKIRFIATDLYGESDSLEIGNLEINNTAPFIYELDYPDTVFIPIVDSTYFSVTVKVDDPQGYLESQDIQNIELILYVSGNPYLYSMRDDGDFNNSGDITANDGIYTKNFKVNSSNTEDTYPLTVSAADKVGNSSNELSGTLIFIKDTKSKIYRVNNAEKFNYSNPFNIK